jgi:hypothetical protein
MRSGVFCSIRAVMLYAGQVGSYSAVSRRVGGWCEMAASLGVSQCSRVSWLVS